MTADHVFTCGDPNCAALIAFTNEQYQHYKETGEGFQCVAGHTRIYRPSTLFVLRKEIETLKATLSSVRRDRDYYQGRAHNRWRCPFAECGHENDSQGSMVRHIKTHHRDVFTPLLLAADAGPDAVGVVH